jgi:hypothetical protein
MAGPLAALSSRLQLGQEEGSMGSRDRYGKKCSIHHLAKETTMRSKAHRHAAPGPREARPPRRQSGDGPPDVDPAAPFIVAPAGLRPGCDAKGFPPGTPRLRTLPHARLNDILCLSPAAALVAGSLDLIGDPRETQVRVDRSKIALMMHLGPEAVDEGLAQLVEAGHVAPAPRPHATEPLPSYRLNWRAS